MLGVRVVVIGVGGFVGGVVGEFVGEFAGFVLSGEMSGEMSGVIFCEGEGEPTGGSSVSVSLLTSLKVRLGRAGFLVTSRPVIWVLVVEEDEEAGEVLWGGVGGVRKGGNVGGDEVDDKL